MDYDPLIRIAPVPVGDFSPLVWNALTHSVNQKAIDELIDREEELHGYMDQFLSKIREFDSAA